MTKSCRRCGKPVQIIGTTSEWAEVCALCLPHVLAKPKSMGELETGMKLKRKAYGQFNPKRQ